VYRDEV
jgi:hypothetical protein